MEWAEQEEKPVDMTIMQGQWDWAGIGDAKLHDLLQNVVAEDALLLVDAYPERGFEAWRQLKRRYDPKSGTFEIDRMISLMTRKQCGSISELPAAIDQLEKDIRGYESRSPNSFPQEWKTPLLIQLVPKSHKREVEIKFQMGQRDYAKMAADLMGFSNDQRVREQRGQQDMDLDAANEEEKWDENDWYYYFHPEELESVDYMSKGGKKAGGKNGGWQTKGGKYGKGGKGGKAGKLGKGDAAAAAAKNGEGKGTGTGTETRVCHWCHKPGHLKHECRHFLAGRPKFPKPAAAGAWSRTTGKSKISPEDLWKKMPGPSNSA